TPPRARRVRARPPSTRGPTQHRGRRWIRGTGRRRRVGGPSRLLEADLEALDQRVREQLVAHAADLVVRGRRIVHLELEVHDTADAGSPHIEPELAQRVADRVALGIENPLFRSNEHRGPHKTTSGCARYSANRTPVSRSNAST